MNIQPNINSVNPYVPNSTQMPNTLFDYWMGVLSPAEFKVLMCIARKTYGWGKSRDSIAFSQIEKMTGLSHRGILKNIQTLIDHGIVIKTESTSSLGDSSPNQYEINIDCEKNGGGELSSGGRELSSPPGELSSGGRELSSPPGELSSGGRELSSHTIYSLPIKESKHISNISHNTHTSHPDSHDATSSHGGCAGKSLTPRQMGNNPRAVGTNPRANRSDPAIRLQKIDDRTKALYPRFVEVLREYKSNYIVKKEINMLESIQEMLQDGRTEDEILDALKWGIHDNEIRGDWNGWSSKILCQNPAAYLCNKFDQIEAASKCKKARKFSPCSNDDAALKAWEEAGKNAL